MSTIKISELATSNIALTDFFAKADATGVANKNTVQELSNLLKTVDDTAFKGSIAVADVPSENGWYFASESGTYTNCGGLVIDTTDNISIIIISGTFDTFNKIDIPVNITIDATIIDGSLNAVSGNAVFDALVLKQDALTFDAVPIEGSTNVPESGGVFALGDKLNNTLYDTLSTNTIKTLAGQTLLSTTNNTINNGSWVENVPMPESTVLSSVRLEIATAGDLKIVTYSLDGTTWTLEDSIPFAVVLGNNVLSINNLKVRKGYYLGVEFLGASLKWKSNSTTNETIAVASNSLFLADFDWQFFGIQTDIIEAINTSVSNNTKDITSTEISINSSLKLSDAFDGSGSFGAANSGRVSSKVEKIGGKLTSLNIKLGVATGANPTLISVRTYKLTGSNYELFQSKEDITVVAESEQVIDLTSYNVSVPDNGLIGVYYKDVNAFFKTPSTNGSYQINNDSGTLPTENNFEFYFQATAEGSYLPTLNEQKITTLELETVSRFRNKKGFYFGDSITAGVNGNYVDYITNILGCIPTNYGSSGADTGRIAAIITPIADRQGSIVYPLPDYTDVEFVTVMMGTNGGVSGTISDANSFTQTCWDVPYSTFTTVQQHLDRYPDTFFGNAAIILDYFNFINSKMQVFMIDAPCEVGFANQQKEISDALNELQALFGCKRIKASTETGINLRNFVPTFSSDGTHFTLLGNEIWGKHLGHSIKQFS